MERPAGVLFAAVALGLAMAGPAPAQDTSGRPSPNGIARQFQSGANRVGHGAAEIGDGIRQGAILTWDAIRDGANAFAARFDDNGPVPRRDPGASGPGGR